MLKNKIIKNNIKYLFRKIIFLIILFLSYPLFSIEITSLELINSTIELNHKNIISPGKNYSEKEIRFLASEIINRYHLKGYSKTFIKKIIVSKKGVLKIIIHEPKIMKLIITGSDDILAREIQAIIFEGETLFFNKFFMDKKIELIKNNYKLEKIHYKIENLDSGDIALHIYYKKKTKNLYGKIEFNPFYGVMPLLGYTYSFLNSGLDLYGFIGYSDEMIRKKEISFTYLRLLNCLEKAIYSGIKSGKSIEVWQKENLEFNKLYYSPFFGYKYGNEIFEISISLNGNILKTENYTGENFYSIFSKIGLIYNNTPLLLNKNEGYSFSINVLYGLREKVSRQFADINFNIEYPFYIFRRVKILTGGAVFYTTSDERLYWKYVYGNNIVGFADNFTSSKWVNSIKIGPDVDILTNILNMGVFINSGYFINEEMKRQESTGLGIDLHYSYKNINLTVTYGWDLRKNFYSGNLILSGRGEF